MRLVSWKMNDWDSFFFQETSESLFAYLPENHLTQSGTNVSRARAIFFTFES